MNPLILEVEKLVRESQIFVEGDQTLEWHDVLEWDSMSLTWFIALLEENYVMDIDYRMIDLQHFQTIQSIVHFIEEHKERIPQ